MRWVSGGSAEKILLTFYEKATTNVWCHSRVGVTFKEEDRCIGLPRIVLSSIVASGALCLEYVKDDQVKSYALLGLAAVGGINSLIGSVALYLDRGKLSGQHKQVAESWNSLSGKIALCLSKPISHRPACDHFLESIQSDFSRLTESSPDVPRSVINAFKKEEAEWVEAGHAVAFYLNGVHELEVFEGDEELTSPSPSHPELSEAARLALPSRALQMPGSQEKHPESVRI